MIRTQSKPAAKPAKPAASDKPAVKAKPQPKPSATPKAKPAKAKPTAKAKKSASSKTVKPGVEKESPQDRTGDRKLDIVSVVAALRKMGGLKTAAAQELGVARSTLYVFLAENQDAIDALTDIDEEMKDIAESKMIQLIRAGDAQTVRWYLELKAKDRGYVRRVENTGPNGGPIETREKQDLSSYTEAELEQMLAIEEAREKREADLRPSK